MVICSGEKKEGNPFFSRVYFPGNFIKVSLPGLNCTALANAPTVSEHSHDIFTYSATVKCLEIRCNTRKLLAECSFEMGGEEARISKPTV